MSLLPLNITLSFSQPSFHPVLHLTFNVPSISDLKDVSNSVFERKKLCEPVAHLEIALPDALFVDPDELSGKWPLHSSSEPAMHQASEGNWKVSGWGLTPPSVNIERPSFGNAALHHTLHVLVRPQAFFEESDAKGGVGWKYRYMRDTWLHVMKGEERCYFQGKTRAKYVRDGHVQRS